MLAEPVPTKLITAEPGAGVSVATGPAASHGKPTQRLLWAIGEAHRTSRGGKVRGQAGAPGRRETNGIAGAPVPRSPGGEAGDFDL